MKKLFEGIFKKVISFFIIIAILFALGFAGYKYMKKKFTLEVSHVTVNNIEVIKEKLETKAELNTGSYLFTDVITKSDAIELKKTGWKIPFTEKSFIISYDGVIKAGIKNLSDAEIIEKDNKIIIKLPKVEITSTEIDNDSFQKLDSTSNIFNPITLEDLNDAQKELKEKMTERAIEKGLLDVATKNAEEVVLEMFDNLEDCIIVIEWK